MRTVVWNATLSRWCYSEKETLTEKIVLIDKGKLLRLIQKRINRCLPFLAKLRGCIMKTYLTIWFSSEGAGPVEVVDRLRSLGFKPLRGYYDHVYDWKTNVELSDILQLTDKIHETLKGLNVLYKIETE